MSWYKQLPTATPRSWSWRAETIEEAKKSLQQRTPVAPLVEEEAVPAPPPVDPEEEARKAREQGYSEGLTAGRQRGFAEGKAAGLEAGLEEGRAQGKEDAYKEHQEALAALEAEHEKALAEARASFAAELQGFVNSAYAAIRDWKEEATAVHTQFALEVAKRAVAQELKLSRDSAVSLAKDALAELHQGVEFRILVNPSDVQVVEAHRQEITEIFSQIRGLEVVPDRSIQNGVVIESQSGTIDARIEAYLQRMAETALRTREAA